MSETPSSTPTPPPSIFPKSINWKLSQHGTESLSSTPLLQKTSSKMSINATQNNSTDATSNHPLIAPPQQTQNTTPAPTAHTIVHDLPSPSDDPLSPLTTFIPHTTPQASSHATITGQINRSIAYRTNPSFLQWTLKSQKILKKYTTNKNIPIISNIQEAREEQENALADDGNDIDPSTDAMAGISPADRLKMRLESLKQKDDLTLLTQTEYIKHLEALNEELAFAWNKRNDRVKSLKIVIKCCKMLGRNPVPQCYPSIFVLVSRVLDTFGQLVRERIRQRATLRDPVTGKLISKLPRIFEPKDVPEEAKDVCRNWFYKISSIRELIARIYVEMSILTCNEYLIDDRDILVSNFKRLARTVRGLGDPLVAAYARTYLARKIIELIPEEKELLMELFSDFLETNRQMQSELFKKYLKKIEMSHDQYMDLFNPAVEWMLEAISASAVGAEHAKLFHRSLNLFQEQTLCHQTFVLDAIVRAFDAELIAQNASLLVNMIFESKGLMAHHVALKSLGEKFAQFPPRGKDQLQLLNVIWKHVAEVDSLPDYIQLAEVYIEYVSKAHSPREVNVLLRHIHSRIEPVANDMNVMDAIEESTENIMLSVMENMPDFVQAFNMEYFLPIFDMLKPNSRIQVSKGILLAFSRRQGTISDPVILNSLYDLAKAVHDSVNELTPRDMQDDICHLLEEFITRVDYGTQFDKQLSFYVDCRRAFSYFDRIKRILTAGVLAMCMRTLQAVRGVHNNKTTNFVKACIAFCHITIPSINDEVMRLRLYLQSAQVSVANNLFSQAETFLELIINDFGRMSPIIISEDNHVVISIEADLVDILSEMSALLIAVPGHPEKGPFVTLQQYLKVIQSFDWEKGSNGRVLVLSRVLRTLYAFYTGEPPYKISTSYSNADLFVVDDKYRKTVEQFVNGVIQLALQDLEAISVDMDVSSTKKRAEGALELVNSLVWWSEVDGGLREVVRKCIEFCRGTTWEDFGKNTVRDMAVYGGGDVGELGRELNGVV